MRNNLKTCELPSYVEAQRFWESGSIAPLVGTYLARSLLISVPLLAINRDPKDAIKNALAASLAVELYVLYKTREILSECK